MKVAITGANGFIGITLLKRLKERGFTPLALVRTPFNNQWAESKIIDYNDVEQISQAISDCDVLIHNAGKTKTLSFSEMLNVNLGITRRIVEAINQQEREIRLIYISSQAVSGPGSAECPACEEDESRPISIYGKSKALAERLIRSQCTQPFNIIRPVPVYGAGDRDFLSLFRLAKYGVGFRIGTQDKPINMISGAQLADFIIRVLENKDVSGETFYASDCQVYSQAEIVRLIARAMGKAQPKSISIPGSLAYGAFAMGDLFGRLRRKPSAVNLEKYREIMAEGWVADCSKARRLLGWDPPYEIEKHLLETIKWYRENGWL